MKQCIYGAQQMSLVIIIIAIKWQRLQCLLTRLTSHPQSSIRCSVGREGGLVEGSLRIYYKIVDLIESLGTASVSFRSQVWFRALPKTHDVTETLWSIKPPTILLVQWSLSLFPLFQDLRDQGYGREGSIQVGDQTHKEASCFPRLPWSPTWRMLGCSFNWPISPHNMATALECFLR